MKIEITLGREDLVMSSKEKDIKDIQFSDFDYLQYNKLFERAHIVAFIDIDNKIKILKDRYV